MTYAVNPHARQVSPAHSRRAPDAATNKHSRSSGTTPNIFKTQFERGRLPPRMAGVFVGGEGPAMSSAPDDGDGQRVADGGLDAATLESLRTEIRAAFRDAFSPLRELASDAERTMQRMREVMARIKESSGRDR